jgi:hypothetical protein
MFDSDGRMFLFIWEKIIFISNRLFLSDTSLFRVVRGKKMLVSIYLQLCVRIGN